MATVREGGAGGYIVEGVGDERGKVLEGGPEGTDGGRQVPLYTSEKKPIPIFSSRSISYL